MIHSIFQKNNVVIASSSGDFLNGFFSSWGFSGLFNDFMFIQPPFAGVAWRTTIQKPSQDFAGGLNINPPIINKDVVSHQFSQEELDAYVAYFDSPEFLVHVDWTTYEEFATYQPDDAQFIDLIKLAATDAQAIWYIVETADKLTVAGDELYAMLFYYIVAYPVNVSAYQYSSKAVLQDYVENTTVNTVGIFNLTDADIANIVDSNWLAGTANSGDDFVALPTALQSLLLDVWYNRVPELLSHPAIPSANNMLSTNWDYSLEPFSTYYSYLRKMLKRT